jgi:hypothetical protein
MNNNTGSQYQGSDIATGSQTPESVTSPDIFDSGVANAGGNDDNA